MKIRLQPDVEPFLPIFSAGIAGALGLWWLVCAFGASFSSGAEAGFCSSLILALMWAVQSITNLPASIAGYTVPALLLPCWWRVLTSLALRQIDPTTGVVALRLVQTWYSSNWFKVLVETGLLALAAWAVVAESPLTSFGTDNERG